MFKIVRLFPNLKKRRLFLVNVMNYPFQIIATNVLIFLRILKTPSFYSCKNASEFLYFKLIFISKCLRIRFLAFEMSAKYFKICYFLKLLFLMYSKMLILRPLTIKNEV